MNHADSDKKSVACWIVPVCVSFVLCPPCCRGVEWHRGTRTSSRGAVCVVLFYLLSAYASGARGTEGGGWGPSALPACADMT